MNIFAHTEPTGPVPAYVSINDRHNDHVTITVRSRGNDGRDIGAMTMPTWKLREMAMKLLEHCDNVDEANGKLKQAPAQLPKPPLGSSHFPSVDEMVNRFLGWRFPADFQPDGGVSFVPSKTHRNLYWPVGTNVLNAVQAKSMILHLLTGGAK